jgi:hypothetical protein
MPRALAVALALGFTLPAAGAEPAAADVASTYRLATDGSSASVQVGQKGRLVVAFQPLAPGVHVDPKAPLRIRVETSAGLKAEKAELRRADALDPSAESPRFEVAVVGVAAGAQEARLDMDFFVCSESWCAKQKRVLRVPVQVR